jgi:cell division protein FtsB
MKQVWPKAKGLDKLKADSSKLKARIEARDQGEKKVKARKRSKLIAQGDQI